MSKPLCLTCRHCHFTAPPDWKPKYSADEYDRYDARDAIKKANRHPEAQCTLNPEWIEVFTNHYCSWWKSGLHDHSNPSEESFLWGSYTERELKDAKEKIGRLASQLKSSQRISASRLARLTGKKKNVKAAPTTDSEP